LLPCKVSKCLFSAAHAKFYFDQVSFSKKLVCLLGLDFKVVLANAGTQADGFNLNFYMASLASLKKAWERYKEISYASGSTAGSMSMTGDELKKIMADIKNMDDIKKAIEETEKGQISGRDYFQVR
jgi:hypothetical protein